MIKTFLWILGPQFGDKELEKNDDEKKKHWRGRFEEKCLQYKIQIRF